MSNEKRLKLSKKMFMSLKPGQWIMDGCHPIKCEEIIQDPASQWDNWRGINGRMVTIYDSRADCLRDCWAKKSLTPSMAKTKYLYFGKLHKKIFMESSTGHYLFFTQDPYECVELKEDRIAQWSVYKIWNGLNVRLYKNHVDCAIEKNELLGYT